MICKEIPKTMYCHIGGSGTWGCEFPEDLNMEGITEMTAAVFWGNCHAGRHTINNGRP